MNDRFLRACRCEAVDRPPVWIMRQAGRYLPEYQEVRSKRTFWEMCTIPEITTEVTLQPVRRLGVDAAILFSDILVPLVAMGMDVRFHPAPEIVSPLRTSADLDRLHPVERDGAVYRPIAEAVRMIRRALGGRTPLIGFAGAPFTVATYAVCGGGSRNQSEMRALLFGDPALAHRVLRVVTEAVVTSLEAQLDAGAEAVQLFDSWAGILSSEDYGEFAFPYADEVLRRTRRPGLPRIYFAPAAMTHLGRIGGGIGSGADPADERPAGAGIDAEVIGIDWRIPLARSRAILGERYAVQGNLDPGVLLGSADRVAERTTRLIAEGRGARGHIVNLGHGILPETPVANARAFVDAVRGSAGAAA